MNIKNQPSSEMNALSESVKPLENQNQTSSELNALLQSVKPLLTQEAIDKFLLFAHETDQIKAAKLRNDVKIVLDFLTAIKDDRKRNKASVRQYTRPPENNNPFPSAPTGSSTNMPAAPTGSSTNMPAAPTGSSTNMPAAPAGSSTNMPAAPAGSSTNMPAAPAGSSTVPGVLPAAPTASLTASSKAEDQPSSIFSKIFGGKPRTFRHRAYYNNTLRNFR